MCSENPQLDSAVEGDPRSRRTGSWLGWKDGGEADVWGTEFLFINLESQLRLAAEVAGNSLSALLDSHPYHVHTHICLCIRTLGVYIMIVNLTFSHCFNVF